MSFWQTGWGGFTSNLIAEAIGIVLGAFATYVVIQNVVSRREEKRWRGARAIVVRRIVSRLRGSLHGDLALVCPKFKKSAADIWTKKTLGADQLPDALFSGILETLETVDALAFGTLLRLEPSDVSVDGMTVVNIFARLPKGLTELRETMADIQSVGIDTPEMLQKLMALEDWWLHLDSAFDYLYIRPILTDPQLRPGYTETVAAGQQDIANCLICCCNATAHLLQHVRKTCQ